MRRYSKTGLVMLCFALWGSTAPHGEAKKNRYFHKTDSEANVYTQKYRSNIDRIAILPFKAPTELIGGAVSDLFVTELLQFGRYTLLERGQMAEVLSETELAMSGLSTAKAVEVGQLIGADGVIIGTVLEYGTRAYKGRTYPVVSISVRMIDTETSQIVWSVDHARQSDDRRASLSGHAQDIVHEMVAGLYHSSLKQKKNPNPRARARNTPSPQPTYSANQPMGYSPGSSLAPETPLDFRVGDFGLRDVRLKWDSPIDSPDEYQIERSQDSEGPFTPIARVSPTKREYIDKGDRNTPLMDSTTYYYRMVAVSETGMKSEPTEVLESLTAPPPDPPREITVNAPSSRCITLNWLPPESEGIREYSVERAMASAPETFTLLGTTRSTSWTDGGKSGTDLKDSTEYIYRLQAVNRVGSEGFKSEPIKIATLPPPVAVNGFTAASQGVRCVPLSWDPHPDTDIEQYTIYRMDGPDEAFNMIAKIKGRTSNRWLDGRNDPGSLPDNKIFLYKIVAENDVGATSIDSQIVKAKTRDVPPRVTGFTGQPDQPREVPLSWDPSPDDKVVGYELFRKRSGDDSVERIKTIESRDTTAFVDEGPKGWLFGSTELGNLEDDATYEYQIKAFNTAQAYSKVATLPGIKTKAAPEAPDLLVTTTHEPLQISIRWPANPEPDIIRYEIQASDRADSGFDIIGDVSGGDDAVLDYTEKELNESEVRFYRIRALDQHGLTSQWSSVESGSAKPLPDAPDAFTLEYRDQSVLVSWDLPPQEDVVEFKLYHKTGFFNWDVLRIVSLPEIMITSEEIGKKESFVVTSIDKDGQESERSDIFELDADRLGQGVLARASSDEGSEEVMKP